MIAGHTQEATACPRAQASRWGSPACDVISYVSMRRWTMWWPLTSEAQPRTSMAHLGQPKQSVRLSTPGICMVTMKHQQQGGNLTSLLRWIVSVVLTYDSTSDLSGLFACLWLELAATHLEQQGRRIRTTPAPYKVDRKHAHSMHKFLPITSYRQLHYYILSYTDQSFLVIPMFDWYQQL